MQVFNNWNVETTIILCNKLPQCKKIIIVIINKQYTWLSDMFSAFLLKQQNKNNCLFSKAESLRRANVWNGILNFFTNLFLLTDVNIKVTQEDLGICFLV